jgi:hypothetical protein
MREIGEIGENLQRTKDKGRMTRKTLPKLYRELVSFINIKP